MNDDRIAEGSSIGAAGAPVASELARTVEAFRVGMKQIPVRNPPASDLVVEQIQLGGVPTLRVLAPGGSADQVICHFHGGGWVSGSAETHLGLLGELSRAAKATVVAPDYSLAPEHPFPTAYDESLRVYEALRTSGHRFCVSGDSGGGGMALGVLNHAALNGHSEVRAGLLISSWADLRLELPSIVQLAKRDMVVSADAMRLMVAAYATGIDLTDPRVSPLLGLKRRLPPLLIQVGSTEVLLDDSLEIDRRARAVGGHVELEVWPEMSHVWHLSTASLQDAHRAIRRAGNFLHEHLRT